MDYAHLHLLLNHLPIFGAIFSFCLLIGALIRKSDELKRASLVSYVIVALLTLPAFLTGVGAADQVKEVDPTITQAMIDTHEGAAMIAFLFMSITGAIALIGWWQYQGKNRPSRWVVPAVFILSILTMGQMARTGNLGGVIRHTEIRPAPGTPESEISRMASAIEPNPTKFADAMLANKWVWAVILDFHFIGLILLVGVIGILDMRLLGFWKQLAFAPLNELLPWGLAGFGIQFTTGFMIFMGMPVYYAYDMAFFLKVIAILLAGANILLFYVSSVLQKCEDLGPGDDAPFSAKFLAGTSMLLWIAVILLGRYIQPYQDTITRR